jgi:agmatinase
MSFPPFPNWNEWKTALAPANSVEYGLKEEGYPMINADTPTFLRQPHAKRPEDLKGVDYVIIGSPYATGDYFGVNRKVWADVANRVRRVSFQSTGYMEEFDINVLDNFKIVDYGDAETAGEELTPDNILKSQRAVELKVGQAIDAGAVPIVIGQNSPPASYAVAKAMAERTKGNVGVISLDEHWDIGFYRGTPLDDTTRDDRIAGHGNWKSKLYEWHKNVLPKNLVEIGERGMYESRKLVKGFLDKGAHFYPMWKVRELGIERLCNELRYAYDGTDRVWVHYDFDVLGHQAHWTLAEPVPMTDYEVLRLSYEIGRRGFNGISFLNIPPDILAYKMVVYTILYFLSGKIMARK